MSRWFRMYDEILDDPKVQRLSPALFRVWVNTLALTSRKDGRLPPVSDCAFAFRETEEAVSSAFHALAEAGLLVTDGETFQPKTWRKRQYKSDCSTDRVRAFRKRSRNADETSPETEAESDTEEPPVVPRRSKGAKVPLPDDWAVPDIWDLPPKARALAAQWPFEIYEAEGEAFIVFWRKDGRGMIDWNATWANRIIAQHPHVMKRLEATAPKAARTYADIVLEEAEQRAAALAK